ncbi:hypothetical protein PUN28_008009 [Cardiocondyla obscurior]|uniref:Uncharacterized protein n=1 Tax=Cardiocondyla obscurior TaxID=286306 RepID=A0AAW2FXP7_9HYME
MISNGFTISQRSGLETELARRTLRICCAQAGSNLPLSPPPSPPPASPPIPSTGSSSSLFLISLSPLSFVPNPLALSSLSPQRPDLSPLLPTSISFPRSPPISPSLPFLLLLPPPSIPLSLSLRSPRSGTLPHLHAYRVQSEREKYVHRHAL